MLTISGASEYAASRLGDSHPASERAHALDQRRFVQRNEKVGVMTWLERSSRAVAECVDLESNGQSWGSAMAIAIQTQAGWRNCQDARQQLLCDKLNHLNCLVDSHEACDVSLSESLAEDGGGLPSVGCAKEKERDWTRQAYGLDPQCDAHHTQLYTLYPPPLQEQKDREKGHVHALLELH